MNKEEMVKEVYTLMVKNNPDEAIKNLIRLDKELDKKNKIVFKAIEYIENNDLYTQDIDYDYDENMVLLPPTDELEREELLDILRGVSDENN